MRGACLLTLLLTFLITRGQQNPALQSFLVVPGQKEVVIQWTMEAGYTCSGLKVNWSTDSTFFTEIYSYPGVCGSTSGPETYSYTHTTPKLNGKNFYQLDLGSYGYSQIAAVSVNSNHRNYEMFPVPFRERSTIRFENPNNRIVNFYLCDKNGQVVRKSNAFMGNTFVLERDGLPEGFYYFVITDEGGFFVYGKTAVSDL